MPRRKGIKGLKIINPKWTQRPELLLCPNTPKPLHGVVPREILGSKWWDNTRKEAYALTNYHCHACATPKLSVKGKRKHLEGHEIYNVEYEKGIMTYVETVALCPFCHKYIHDGRLTALLHKRIITFQHFTSVIQHGDKVLSTAGMKKKNKIKRDDEINLMIKQGKIPPWEEWRLILNGEEHPPKFKTIEEWKEAHDA